MTQRRSRVKTASPDLEKPTVYSLTTACPVTSKARSGSIAARKR